MSRNKLNHRGHREKQTHREHRDFLLVFTNLRILGGPVILMGMVSMEAYLLHNSSMY